MGLSNKTKLFLICIAVEWLFFGGWYLIGNEGLRSLVRLNQECRELEVKVAALQTDISQLTHECDAWKNESFYVERFAREKLSMSYPHEKVALIQVR